MKVSVWDTYVKREDGSVMHFDIIVRDMVTDEQSIFKFGNDYLSSKPFSTLKLTANECRFCHFEKLTPEMSDSILENGYTII